MESALELFEPSEYLDKRGPGYFSILAKMNGKTVQESYELQHLETVVGGLNPNIDTWISQATFTAPNRRAVNLYSVGLLFADLDTYNIPGLQQKKPEQISNLLILYCGDRGVPAPSIVLFSGRGLQAKWLLANALPPSRLYEWNHIQRKLVDLLNDFGSDHNAKDISRVLRLDRTVNTKSGERCRVVYVNSGVEAVPTRYDFEEIAELFPEPEPEERPKKTTAKVLTLPHEMNLRRLNWYRLYDIRDLWKLRGGVPKGYRETTLFWELNFLLRADPGKTGDMWKEAQTLAAEIDDHNGFYRNSDLSTLYGKAKANKAGGTVLYKGKRHPPLYTPRNDTLINLFKITPDEEKNLRTIISKQEKYRRKVEKRRDQGMREQAYRYSRPWESLEISRRTFYRSLERAGKRGEESFITRVGTKCVKLPISLMRR